MNLHLVQVATANTIASAARMNSALARTSSRRSSPRPRPSRRLEGPAAVSRRRARTSRLMLVLGCAARGGRAEGEYHGCDDATDYRSSCRARTRRLRRGAGRLRLLTDEDRVRRRRAGVTTNSTADERHHAEHGHEHDHRHDHHRTTAPTGTAGGTAAPAPRTRRPSPNSPSRKATPKASAKPRPC